MKYEIWIETYITCEMCDTVSFSPITCMRNTCTTLLSLHNSYYCYALHVCTKNMAHAWLFLYYSLCNICTVALCTALKIASWYHLSFLCITSPCYMLTNTPSSHGFEDRHPVIMCLHQHGSAAHTPATAHFYLRVMLSQYPTWLHILEYQRST